MLVFHDNADMAPFSFLLPYAHLSDRIGFVFGCHRPTIMAVKSVEPQERENDATLDFESFKDDIVGVNLESSIANHLGHFCLSPTICQRRPSKHARRYSDELYVKADSSVSDDAQNFSSETKSRITNYLGCMCSNSLT